MKLHDTTPGEILYERILYSIQEYEKCKGVFPKCIELTKEECLKLEYYFKDMLQYPNTVRMSTICGVPIFVN